MQFSIKIVGNSESAYDVDNVLVMAKSILPGAIFQLFLQDPVLCIEERLT